MFLGTYLRIAGKFPYYGDFSSVLTIALKLRDRRRKDGGSLRRGFEFPKLTAFQANLGFSHYRETFDVVHARAISAGVCVIVPYSR